MMAARKRKNSNTSGTESSTNDPESQGQQLPELRIAELTTPDLDASGSSYIAATEDVPKSEESLSGADIPITIEAVRLKMMNDAGVARACLNALHTKSKGFCRLSILKPSKEGGYIQLSYGGANKFAVLQEVLVWSRGEQIPYLHHASHLCDEPACTIPEHIVVETPAENNSRKNCGVINRCPHNDCDKLVSTCTHNPRCIYYIGGYQSWDEMLSLLH
jgi:hypothetical protein